MPDLPVIILAAGQGIRLRPLTETVPKCLLKVADKAILDHQLDCYLEAGVDRVYIVVGYRSSMVRRHCADRDMPDVQFIENEHYAETNNMFSLYLAQEWLSGRRFILSNGDCIYESMIVDKVVGDPNDDFIACQRGMHDSEAMKLTVDDRGLVQDISKDIPREDSFGISIDIHRFSARNSAIFFDRIEHIIFEQGRRNEWFEVGLRVLFHETDFAMHALDVGHGRRAEIDTPTDLEKAREHFSTQSEDERGG